MRKVFVVEDRFSIIQALCRWFISKGCEVRAFSKSMPLFDALHESLPDMIVIDADLTCEDGRSLRALIKAEFCGQVLMVLFSSFSYDAKKIRNKEAHSALLPQGFIAC